MTLLMIKNLLSNLKMHYLQNQQLVVIQDTTSVSSPYCAIGGGNNNDAANQPLSASNTCQAIHSNGSQGTARLCTTTALTHQQANTLLLLVHKLIPPLLLPVKQPQTMLPVSLMISLNAPFTLRNSATLLLQFV
jgi:hypothetical protein